MNIYNFDIIPYILECFKVENVIITSLSDKVLVNKILEYDASINAFDSKGSADFNQNLEIIDGKVIDKLSEFNNCDAVFINDDANWYTVYMELNIIKKYFDSFPLVFICNNKFPNKRRDSYSDPKIIPKEFLHEFVDEFPVYYNNDEIIISDNQFHACEENTDKNGVLTAIEDFLIDNDEIGIVDINFVEEISILYLKSNINHIRLDKVNEKIIDMGIDYDYFSDQIRENNILLDYINQFNISHDERNTIGDFNLKISQKNNIIEDYENKIQIHDNELEYKNSQINNVKSKLNLKESQIDEFKSKLFNKENEINLLQNKIQSANYEIDSLNNKIKNNIAELDKQVKDGQDEIHSLLNQIDGKNSNIAELHSELNSLKRDNIKNLSKIKNNEYCMGCFKNEILNKHTEIDYINNHSIIQSIFSPLSYLYLILKSKPKEISLNLKLYKAIKNSKCFDIGYYLNNNPDLIESKWCKYFSPELHYVCNGFNEKRKFNKKYFKNNSKQELLNYLKICSE